MCRLEYAGTTFVQTAEHSGHANVLRPAKPLPKHLRGSQAWNRLMIRCVLRGCVSNRRCHPIIIHAPSSRIICLIPRS